MVGQVDRVNGLVGTLGMKAPVRAASTANLTLSGEQTVDGVALVEWDRVLVKDQTTATENGIYDVQTGAWTRAADFDGARDVMNGTAVPIGSEGTTNANMIWSVTTTGDIVPGTTSLTFGNVLLGVYWTDLTDGGASALHYHTADRARANHTGTQLAATISDFDSAVDGSSHAADTLNPHSVTAAQAGAKVSGAVEGFATGGTGQATQQDAIDALTAVSAATNEHVLTKDTATGNAIFKVPPTAASSITYTSQVTPTPTTNPVVISVAHGLGAALKRVELHLVCITGELGFTAGDVITSGMLTGASLNPTTTGFDATNAWFTGGGAGGFSVARKDTGVLANITPANWAYRFALFV